MRIVATRPILVAISLTVSFGLMFSTCWLQVRVGYPSFDASIRCLEKPDNAASFIGRTSKLLMNDSLLRVTQTSHVRRGCFIMVVSWFASGHC